MQLLKGWQHAPRAETARRSTGWRNSVQPVPTRIKRIVPQRPLPLAAMEDIRRLEQATRLVVLRVRSLQSVSARPHSWHSLCVCQSAAILFRNSHAALVELLSPSMHSVTLPRLSEY